MFQKHADSHHLIRIKKIEPSDLPIRWYMRYPKTLLLYYTEINMPRHKASGYGTTRGGHAGRALLKSAGTGVTDSTIYKSVFP